MDSILGALLNKFHTKWKNAAAISPKEQNDQRFRPLRNEEVSSTAQQETQEIQVQSLGREDLLEKEMARVGTLAFLPEKPQAQRSLVG